MTFQLEPHFERLIVKVDKVQGPETSLILADDVAEQSTTGIVIAIGPMVKRDTTIEVGQRIAFRKFSGEAIKWDGEDYLLMLANDALYTIHEKEQKSSLRSV